MKTDLHYGRAKYVSFIVLDIICLITANLLAMRLYLSREAIINYGYEDHLPVVIVMVAIDLSVIIVLNPFCRALRRRRRTEIITGIRHVSDNFFLLAVILFTFRQGAVYSRATVYLAYIIYLLLFITTHQVLKRVLQRRARHEGETAILVTTDRFAQEGLEELKKLNIEVRYIYLLKNLNKDVIGGIPVVKTWEEAAAATCWDLLDRVFIYGLDHQMVPERLADAFHEMKLELDLVDFNYRIIDVKTVRDKEDKYGSLSFLEGKRDIPFPIRRVYWITETEADLHRGFHAHKLNCQLLFCPYGVIDIILDDGKKRETVTLDEPGKGLILMPGLWREMRWQKSGSVLCVLASEYYDADEYIRDYDEFIAYSNRYRESGKTG